MTTLFRAGMGLALLATLGCETPLDRLQPGATDAIAPPADASAPPADASTPAADASRPSGAVGAHVWFASSTGIQLSEHWSFDTWGPDAGPPPSGTSCLTLDRAAMNDAQLAALGAIVLIPLTDACGADGYEYVELTVLDSDGSTASYRDTGCNYLRLEGAMALLPQGTLVGNLFPLTASSSCPP